jgi:HSP20 family protein
MQGDQMTISGRRQIAEQKDAGFWRRERTQGSFVRTLTVPWKIDSDKIEATLRDGVLTIKLPKAEQAKPRKVKVLTA